MQRPDSGSGEGRGMRDGSPSAAPPEVCHTHGVIVFEGCCPDCRAAEEEPRAWVARLGSYLRIFGFARGVYARQPEARWTLDSLERMAKEKEIEHGA